MVVAVVVVVPVWQVVRLWCRVDATLQEARLLLPLAVVLSWEKVSIEPWELMKLGFSLRSSSLETQRWVWQGKTFLNTFRSLPLHHLKVEEGLAFSCGFPLQQLCRI